MANKKLEEFTQVEFLEFVRKVFFCEFETDDACDRSLDDFVRIVEHPAGTDLIFYPSAGRPDSPEGIVAELEKWRLSNGRLGFKEV